MSKIYSFLLTGIKPNYCIGNILADQIESNNPNLQITSFFLSGFIAKFYPDLFGDKLIDLYKKESTWERLYEVYCIINRVLYHFLIKYIV